MDSRRARWVAPSQALCLLFACMPHRPSPPGPSPQATAWSADLAAGRSAAAAAGVPLVVDVTATWCAGCRRLADETLCHPEVLPGLAAMARVRLDVSDAESAAARTAAELGIVSLPHIAFACADGALLDAPRIRTFVPPARLRRALADVRERVCAPRR